MVNLNYITPFEIAESAVAPRFIRGEYRGLYGSGLRYTLLPDGKYISGSNEYAGKIFRAHVMGSANEVSIFLVETSNTVRYNEN